MTPSEDTLAQLSALLDGELPMDQAEALRARIQAEPELAAAWNALMDLDAGLADLEQAPPPLELDARVLEQAKGLEPKPLKTGPLLDVPAAKGAPKWAWGLLAAGLLLAATPLLALTDWAQPAPPTLHQASGQQVVHGPALVLLPDGRELAVSGRVSISVEPPAPLPRVEGQEVEMNPKMLLAAAAGAAITVAVYEGSATLSGPEGTQVLEAGDSSRVGPDRARVTSPVPRGAELAEGTPQAEPEGAPESTEALKGELERLQLQNDFLQGQLTAMGATPNPWPEALDAAFTPEAFEDTVSGALADFPDVELLDVDCSEYPCVAIFEDQGVEKGRESMEAFRTATTDALGGDLNSSAWGAQIETDQGSRYVEVWALTPDTDMNSGNARLDLRAKDLLQEELDRE
ncbi:MAG: hypothetical protein VX899_13615 [Myxococcota bacterium]|nr:hypothetical protein [Myxococcota bacterium]